MREANYIIADLCQRNLIEQFERYLSVPVVNGFESAYFDGECFANSSRIGNHIQTHIYLNPDSPIKKVILIEGKKPFIHEFDYHYGCLVETTDNYVFISSSTPRLRYNEGDEFSSTESLIRQYASDKSITGLLLKITKQVGGIWPNEDLIKSSLEQFNPNRLQIVSEGKLSTGY